MYQFIFIDMSISVIAAPDLSVPQPVNELRLIKTGEQTVENARRYYYLANPPRRILIVARNGSHLESAHSGQYWKALIGWDEGDNPYVLPGDENKRHTKISIDLLIDIPGFNFQEWESVPLSTIVEKAPRSDRPGGVRGVMAGRPPVLPGDRVERHSVTLPSRLWRRIETTGDGNRSAGVRKLIEGEDAMATFLPASVGQALLAWPGATAVAMEVDGQAAIVAKMERRDAQSAHRPGVPVAFQSQLGLYPDAGAVIRLAMEIRDQPGHPIKFETFLDPGQPQDAALLRKLQAQETLAIHIFDMRINYQYSKVIPLREIARNDLAMLCAQAEDFLTSLPPNQRDFGKARDQMMAEMPL